MISYRDWVGRFGVPVLHDSPEIVLRDDPPEGSRMTDIDHFKVLGSWRLTTPTPEQARWAWYDAPEPGFCHARIAMPWGCTPDGEPLICAVILAVAIKNVPCLNRASNADLQILFEGLVANGARVEIVGPMPRRERGWFG